MDSFIRDDIKNPVKSGFFYFIASLFFAMVFLPGCTGNGRFTNAVVVQVNEHKLTTKKMAELLARQLKSLDALAAKDPINLSRAKEEIVRTFIINSISKDYAKSFGIVVSDAEIDAEVNATRATYPDDLSFRRELAQENLSLNDWRDEISTSLLSKKVFLKVGEKIKKPTDVEIRSYFEKNKEHYRRKDRIFLRQIVLDDLTKAQTVREEVAKKKDFSELAKKYSVSPEGKQGGVVGWIERGSVDIFDKAFQLPLGGVSQVLESAYGFHIFKTERRAASGIASLDEVRPQIIDLLQAQKEQIEFMGWLDKQLRSVRVLKNAELIQAINVETRGQK